MKWKAVLVLVLCFLSIVSSAPKKRSRPKGRPGPRRKATPLKSRSSDASSATDQSEESELSSLASKGNKKGVSVAAAALKLVKKPAAKLAIGLVAAGLIAVRVRNNVVAKSTKGLKKTGNEVITSKSALDPASSFTDLFSVESKNAVVGDTSTNEGFEGAEAWAAESGKGYTILLFDVDSSLSDATDIKARTDYFKLMGNLTAAATEKKSVPLQTLYVPGKGNKNLLEKQEASAVIGKGSGSWKYLSSQKGSRGPDVAAALRQKYGVNGEELRIVVLGPDHTVITDHGLDCLRVDPYGLPWIPEPVAGLLSQGGLLGGGGANVSSEVSLTGKNTAIYFSASWCQPCKKFTPQLVEAYHTAMADGHKDKLDVLFVSLDSEEEAFNKYRASMPWPAVGFKDSRRALLQIGLGIKSIPALVVLDPAGKVLCSSGVTEIAMNKTLTDLISSKIEAADLGKSVEILQRNPVCIAICDDNDHEKTQALMTEVAQSSASPVMVPRGPRESLVHCVLDKSSKMAEAIRSLCGLGVSSAGSVDVVVLDLVQELFGHTNLLSADGEAIKKFSTSYKSYNLPMKGIKSDASGR